MVFADNYLVHVKVHVNNGVVTAVEPEDLINPNMPMEDKYISNQAIMNGLIQYRPFARDLGLTGLLYNPNRGPYPMQRVSQDRGTLTGTFVPITWQEALDTVAQAMQSVQQKYGSYSILNNPLGTWQGCNVSTWGDPSTEGADNTTRFMTSSLGSGVGAGWTGTGNSVSLSTAFDSQLIVLYGHDAVTSQVGD